MVPICMLSYFPAGITTDGTGIFNGALANNDGHGWAIIIPAAGNTPARIMLGHGMSADRVTSDFCDARDKHPHGAALFHSRWATHGSVGEPNCHPFTVGGDPRIVLAHNGILPAKARPKHGDDRSDTRKFAESILPKWGSLDDRGNRKRIGQWLGSNKVLVLSVHPKSKQSAYLFGEELGTWDKAEGVWYSNHDFQYRPYVKPWAPGKTQEWVSRYWSDQYADRWSDGWEHDNIRPATGREIESAPDTTCALCEAKDGVNLTLNMCRFCNSCQDCGGTVQLEDRADDGTDDCSCWYPANVGGAERGQREDGWPL